MKNVTPKDIERLSRESARTLYGDDYISPIPSIVGAEKSTRESDQIGATQGELSGQESLSSVTSAMMEATVLSRPLENASKIMRAQSAQRFPFLLRSEAARLAGIKGSASLLNAEKAALESGYIIKHEIPRGKTRVVFWEITNRGYAALGKKKPPMKSKGHYVHKLCAYRIADSFKKKGDRVNIEHRISTGKLVDIAIHGYEGVKYVEVCSSHPLEKELINLERDLAGDEAPIELIFAVTQRPMKDALLRLIERYLRFISTSCPVSVVLAGDLIVPLEGGQCRP